MSRDAFPNTVSQIGRWIEAGELEEAKQYLMQVYPRCLEIYVAGSSYRNVGDPADLVRGFLADRLDREHFLDDWIASGKRLRYWLINALRFHIQEVLHEHRRARRAGSLEVDVESDDDDHVHAIDRAYRAAIVEAALESTARACEEANQREHWHVFLRHRLESESFPQIASGTGLTAERAAVMSRTAERRFIKTLRELLNRDCFETERIDTILRDLLEI